MSCRSVLKRGINPLDDNIGNDNEDGVKSKVEEVELVNFSFVPRTVRIPVGSSIRWTNRHAAKNDDQIQWVNGRNPSESQQKTTVIKSNMSYTHTFMESGTFQCHSVTYPWVKSTIIVMKNLAANVNIDNVHVNIFNSETSKPSCSGGNRLVQYHEDGLDSPTSGTASSETSPSFLSGHIDSSYGSGSFVSSSGIDDFGGDESYEASDAYSNDENSYYNENKRKNQAEERHDEYGSDSSGSFACHDEDRDSEGV